MLKNIFTTHLKKKFRFVCFKVKFSTFNPSLSLNNIKKEDLKLKFSLLNFFSMCVLKSNFFTFKHTNESILRNVL
jgi:hypothetical protein